MGAVGHRARWTAAWLLLLLWCAALITGTGGATANVLLVAGVALVLYELLSADPAR